MRRLRVAVLLLTTAALVALAGGRGGDPASAGATSGWSTLTPSPIERTEVGAGRIGDRIYVVGGFLASGQSTGRMTRYDVSDDTWSEERPLPIAVNHPGVTAHRGHLYVLGGVRDDGTHSDRLYRYDPEHDRWKRLPDAPTGRAALAFVGIAGRLYAAGGMTHSTGEYRGLEIFDLDRRRWREGPPMPTGRNHVAAAIHKGGIVVTGGRTNEGTNLDVVERFYSRNGRWNRMPSLNVPRSGHAAATLPRTVLPGRMVVFGGEELSEGEETIDTVEYLDRSTGDWSSLAPMPTPRHGLGGVAAGDTVFAAEGGPQPGLSVSNALEALQVAP